MTPLEAFEEDVASLFADYTSGAIEYDQAVVLFSERSDLLLQAYVIDTPDEVIDALFQQFSELRLMACEKGDIPADRALEDISDQALALYPDTRERFAHADPVQAELLFRIPSPEAA
jgi:hypothetical protein